MPEKQSGQAVDSNTMNAVLQNQEMALNIMTTRANMMSKLFDPRRDIDDECGYPKTITEIQYRVMFDREIGRRVVNVYPEETWKQFPSIYEDAKPDNETAFEGSFKALEKRHHLLHYLQRADELSGVGQYGIILWGLSDQKGLDDPVDGWETWEESSGKPRSLVADEHHILYIRVLDASLVSIASYETDANNPRYGLPTQYTLTLSSPSNVETGGVNTPSSISATKVHWTRITHIADNRGASEVLGTPRMEPVWNRLCDLRKVLGGSGEMYWKGGFPGMSLETQPGNENAVLDEDKTRNAMFDFMNGSQRALYLTGMTAKSHLPQIADPTASFEVQVKAICITLGIPFRVFMGIEEGVVSGDQATKAWDGRLKNRQARYATPMIINPVLQRLVDYGVLKPTVEPRGWIVEWPDLTAASNKDRAEVAKLRTEALAKYVGGGVDSIVPPMEYLTIICGLEEDIAETIIKAATAYTEEEEEDIEPDGL